MGRLAWVFGAAIALGAACGGTTTDTGDGGGDAANPHDAGNPDVVGQPPPPPADGGTATTSVRTFALHKLYLGETNRSGVVGTTAWKGYGVNIDGLLTTKSSTDVCTLAPGAPTANQTDGDNGNDNAWGETLLPILQTAASLPTPSDTVTQAIQAGQWTMQLQVMGLSDDPQQSATGLTAQIFSSGLYGQGTPAFDTSTDWPVLSTCLNDPTDLSKGAIAAFGSAYVTGGTFVSGPGPDPLVLDIDIQGIELKFNVHHAVITFDHTAPAEITNGTIAGVLDTQEVITTMQSIAGQFSTALCGTAFNGIAQQIQQASDILGDGTNHAGTPCNAISIGLGFDAVEIANPTEISLPPVAPPNPCP
jgi:hypothetical protein